MSGVFGIVASQEGGAPGALVSRMARSLALREWFTTSAWQSPDESAALGQVGIGLMSRENPIASSGDGRVVATAFGEIWDRPAAGASGDDEQPLSPADIVARYLDDGTKFIASLEGAFVLAIWDGRVRQLVLANDRLGLLPTYYAHPFGRLVFAPQIRTLLEDHRVSAQLDLTGVAEMVRFQRLLGERTLVEAVRLLPHASILKYRADQDTLSIQPYWDFEAIPSWPKSATFEDAVEESSRLLKTSIRRSLHGPLRPGVYLSGGLDSRTVLALAQQGHAPIPSVTYGLPQSRDVMLAQRIARRVGSDHHLFLQTDARWLLDKVDFHLQMTEGQTTFLHAHAALTLEAAREWMDVNLTGFEGDLFLGARALDFTTWAASADDDLTFRSRMYDHFTQDLSWPGLTDTEEKSLFQPPYDRELRDRAYDSLGEELRRFQQFPLPRRLEFFLTLNHTMRLTHMNMVYQGAFMETRYPFCDYRLIDLAYSMPIDYRMHDKLYLAVINHLIPEVTWIPRASDEVILTSRPPFRTMHRLMQKGKHRFNRHVWRLFPEHTAFHGDPETWFRRDWSDWAAGILFDTRTRDRGIFAPAALHSLYRRHMSGNELWTIGKIAPLITVEMAIRYLLDDAPYAQAVRPAA